MTTEQRVKRSSGQTLLQECCGRVDSEDWRYA